ncbi:sensor histidine kinase [Psychroserpens sp.]|uniref:sensor histidine kinase n=1 Tax=Psychroserpens sp. TaxID=2020870 RepID=UPI001B103B8C|nr:histidine kinase [Psychroserpens sp.]MBO6607935.1 histidine kinase [Psychroserpens sp.]
MNIKYVKHSTILGIAGLIAALINLPRVLELYNVLENLGKSFADVTVSDIVIRILFMFTFCWIGLQFNTNWKHRYFGTHKALNIGLTIIVNVIVFFLTLWSFIWVHEIITNSVMNRSDKGLLYFVYFVILLIVIFISRILRFQIVQQEDNAEKELLKRQSLQNELSALKNQINPHFLFNSLNSLNSLVRGNEQATNFVNNLSYMYRYILQSGQQDLVTLSEELKFLDSYIHLIKTRYRDRFSIAITIDDIHLNKTIPSLTLQLLVENAVKHNEISEDKPLLVNIYSENDMLVVENDIQPRTTLVESTGQGIANINKRYILLKDKHISISESNNKFIVKLPLK